MKKQLKNGQKNMPMNKAKIVKYLKWFIKLNY